MNTIEIDGVIFHYNQDLSGDVFIRLAGSENEIAIPGETLIKFLLELPSESVIPLANKWVNPTIGAVTRLVRAIEPKPKLITKTWSDDE